MYKLLLADDSVTIQRVIELTFSGEDIQVIAVNDGEQAIARIPTEHPDIVLADIGMPKRSGYDVAAFVKGQPEFAHIPVLLLAGAFERVDEARAEEVKCDGVLVKPFEPRHVVARVRELIAGVKGKTSQPVVISLPPDRLVSQGAYEPALSPVESLVEAPSERRNALAVEPRAETPPQQETMTSGSFVDAGLDEYFEKLNEAFEDSRASDGGPESTASTQGGDSLDGYFNRLSAAFADLAKPLRDSDVPPASFDELLGDDPVLTMEEAVEGQSDGEVPPPAARALVVESASIDMFPATLPPPSTSSLPTSTVSSLAPSDSASYHSAATAAVEDPVAVPEEDVNGIADVLSALLAEESDSGETGEVRSTQVPLATSAAAPAADETLVEEVTRRVLERLVPEVSASLKRLVAEEIERVGSRQ